MRSSLKVFENNMFDLYFWYCGRGITIIPVVIHICVKVIGK